MGLILTQKANEESTYVVAVTFYDESGIAVIPVSVVWTLTDSDGTVINLRTAVVATPAATVNIILGGDDLALPSSDLRRIILVYATYNSSLGNGLALREEIEFEIEPLVNVT